MSKNFEKRNNSTKREKKKTNEKMTVLNVLFATNNKLSPAPNDTSSCKAFVIVISWLDTYLRTRARTKAPSYYVRPVVVCDFDRRMSHRGDIEKWRNDLSTFSLSYIVSMDRERRRYIFCAYHFINCILRIFEQNNNPIPQSAHVSRPLEDLFTIAHRVGMPFLDVTHLCRRVWQSRTLPRTARS